MALAAFGHVILTQYLLLGHRFNWFYPGFIFCGTLVQYGAHRLISLHRHRNEALSPRFEHIQQLKWIIIGLTGLGFLIAIYCWTQLLSATQLFLLAPILISISYILPIWKNKRLRDVPFIKIFLIAIVWTLLTSRGMAIEWGLAGNYSTLLQLPERILFLFAITLPFDIRDLELDRRMPVKTLPGQIGIRDSKLLALMTLVCSILLVYIQARLDWYSWNAMIGFLPSYLAAAFLIVKSRPGISDYYYTFFLDGTLVLQAVGVCIMTIFE